MREWHADRMASAQTLIESDRRIVALWAADCAERVLPLFEAEESGTVGHARGSSGPAPSAGES